MSRDSWQRVSPDLGREGVGTILREVLRELHEAVYPVVSVARAKTAETVLLGTALSPAGVLLIRADSALTLTSQPTILDGSDMQEILVVNAGAANITLKSGTSYNLRLTGDLVLTEWDSVRLTYLADLGDWLQTGPLTAVT